jgi:hypothetical protein
MKKKKIIFYYFLFFYQSNNLKSVKISVLLIFILIKTIFVNNATLCVFLVLETNQINV